MASYPLLPKLISIALAYGGLLWIGYIRRRNTWTPQSWRRFGLLLTLSVAALAAAFRMAVSVDEGVYQAMAPLWRRAYFLAMSVLLLGGVVASFGLVLWFARGGADRQLSFRRPSFGKRSIG